MKNVISLKIDGVKLLNISRILLIKSAIRSLIKIKTKTKKKDRFA